MFVLRAIPLLCLLLVIPTSGHACPEIIVPVDPQDTALKAQRWRAAMQAYQAQRHTHALRRLRKTAKAIGQEVNELFHPGDKATSNRRIQRWLQRHVYTRNPSVLAQGDGFTFPILVWWAWADTACRAGHYKEAKRALTRLVPLRSDSNVRFHQALIAQRLGDHKSVTRFLRSTLPDRYMTPYMEGLVALNNGDISTARSKLEQAKDAAILQDRRAAAQRAIQSLPAPKTPDDSR